VANCGVGLSRPSVHLCCESWARGGVGILCIVLEGPVGLGYRWNVSEAVIYLGLLGYYATLSLIFGEILKRRSWMRRLTFGATLLLVFVVHMVALWMAMSDAAIGYHSWATGTVEMPGNGSPPASGPEP